MGVMTERPKHTGTRTTRADDFDTAFRTHSPATEGTELALDSKTIEVLKTFEKINQGLVVGPGNVLRTSAPRGTTVAARVTVPVTFLVPFSVWDLSRFLIALDTFQKPKLTFLNKGQVGISDVDATEAGLMLRYPLTTPDCIDTLDEDPAVEPTLVFSLSGDRLKMFVDLGKRLDLPHLVLRGDGSQLLLTAADASKPEGIQVGGEMTVGKSDKRFRLVWAAEDWRKVLTDDYKVGIAIFPSGNGGVAHLVSLDGNAHFWLLTRTVNDSHFGGGRKVK
jgi:hypothetical protein